MELKTYKKLKIFFTILIAVVVGQSILLENLIFPLVTVVVGSLALLLLRRRVKEIILDERDREIAGKSALLAVQIYSWIAVVAMLAFYAFRSSNPVFEPVGMVLAYSTCLLTIIYSFIFRYYEKSSLADKKMGFIIFVILLSIFGAVFSLRLFSGEDNWICQNGQWVKHGSPSFPAPATECKQNAK